MLTIIIIRIKKKTGPITIIKINFSYENWSHINYYQH